MRRFSGVKQIPFSRVMQHPAIQRDASFCGESKPLMALISEVFSCAGDAKDSRDPTGWQRFVGRVKQCVPSVWEKLSSSMVSAPSVHG